MDCSLFFVKLATRKRMSLRASAHTGVAIRIPYCVRR